MEGVDFGKTASDYGQHRQGFPDSLFDRLGIASQRVVDVGTGTGTLARGFAARGCEVVGIDPSEPMLEEARRLGPGVDFRVGTAEQTGLPDGWADAFTAGQCWHWFDRHAAAREAFRVLRPGGRIAICHFNWVVIPGQVAHATEQLVLAHNPTWFGANHDGSYPWWVADVRGAGFTDVEVFTYDVDSVYSHEAWRGRIRACAGVAASNMAPEQVARFDEEHAAMLRDRFPEDPLVIPHRVWALVAVRP